MPLYVLLLVTLLVSGAFMASLLLAFRSPRFEHLRIREEKNRKLKGPKVYARMLLNSLFSAALVFAIAFGFYDRLFYEEVPPVWRIGLELVGVLFVYDFAYYFLHRYPFHEWKILKRVHAVHHVAKHPIAADSLYLHPVENFLGLALLMTCTFVVGPVHVYSFGAIFFVYSILNIAVHCGLDLPFFGHMARKHDKHHASMRGGNYASITPLPDLVFGTAE